MPLLLGSQGYNSSQVDSSSWRFDLHGEQASGGMAETFASNRPQRGNCRYRHGCIQLSISAHRQEERLCC